VSFCTASLYALLTAFWKTTNKWTYRKHDRRCRHRTRGFNQEPPESE